MTDPLRQPPAPRVSRVFLGLRRALGGSYGEDLHAFDAAAVEQTLETLRHFYAPGGWFDLDVTGFEQIPRSPVLLVSNHSGGTSIPDVWGFAVSWYARFGTQRPLYVLGHELLFSARPWGRYFERRGVLRATPAVAREVLEQGSDLLVMPGGDRDAWRPWTKRHKVHFAGHRGYARLALEQQVPVIPVAHVGAHDTLRVLSSGEGVARWFGLGRLARAEIWPIHLSLPWGLAIGPWPHLPLPARFRYLIGPPITPRPPPVDEAEVEALDEQVRHAVQAQLDVLAAEREKRGP